MTTPSSNFIGINVSGTLARAALVNFGGELLETKVTEITPKQIIPQLAALVEDLARRAPVASIGVAIPGLVNRQTDRVIAPRDMPSAMVEDLPAQLMQATGLRVELENDANAAAYGEYKAGAGLGARNMFYMMIGNGIGGAIIVDGKLWTGASGFAGEVGHITIEKEGDAFALMMIERTGKYIGTGVATVINLLNIERIVLGGGVMDAGSLILNPIIQEAKRRAFQPCFEATQIVAAKLGLDAAPIGAALLARDVNTD